MARKPANRGERTEIGRRIQSSREAVRMTQQELADKIGVIREMISQVEHGRSPIPVELVPGIADALRIDPMTLIPESDRDPATRARVQMARLSPEQQAVVLALMDSLVLLHRQGDPAGR